MSGRLIPLAPDVPLDPVPPVRSQVPPPGIPATSPSGAPFVGMGSFPGQDPFPQYGEDPVTPPQPALQPLDPSVPLDHTSQSLGFMEGLYRPFDNAAHWMAETPIGRGIDSVGTAMGLPSTDQATTAHQSYFQGRVQNGEQPGKIGDFAGSLLASVPLALATKNPWIGGGAFGALNTEHPDDAKQVAWDAGLSAIGGGVAGKAIDAASSVLSPQVSKLVQTLLDKGVRLTPGQIAGGWGQKLEDGMTHLPFVGTAIADARNASMADFQRATIDQVLQPLEALKNSGINAASSLPEHIPTGSEAVSFAKKTLGDAYDSILAKGHFVADDPFISNLGKIYDMASDMPAKEGSHLVGLLDNYVFNPIAKTGKLTGQGFKDIYSQLGTMSSKFTKSASAFEQDIGNGLKQTQAELRDAFYRGNPTLQPLLDATDKGYSLFAKVRAAAASLGKDGGEFSPANLVSALRSADTSVGKSKFATGSMPMQKFAEAGKAVLPSTVGDSGTAARTAIQNVIGGLATGGAGMSAWAHGIVPTLEHMAMISPLIAALRGTYTQKGGQILTKALTERPDGVRAVANALSKAKGPATYAGAAAAPQLYARRGTQP